MSHIRERFRKLYDYENDDWNEQADTKFIRFGFKSAQIIYKT